MHADKCCCCLRTACNRRCRRRPSAWCLAAVACCCLGNCTTIQCRVNDLLLAFLVACSLSRFRLRIQAVKFNVSIAVRPLQDFKSPNLCEASESAAAAIHPTSDWYRSHRDGGAWAWGTVESAFYHQCFREVRPHGWDTQTPVVPPAPRVAEISVCRSLTNSPIRNLVACVTSVHLIPRLCHVICVRRHAAALSRSISGIPDAPPVDHSVTPPSTTAS